MEELTTAAGSPYSDVAALLGGTAPEEDHERDVELSGGRRVRVRGLTRMEAHHIGSTDDGATRDRRMLTIAMVAPTVTEEQVMAWQKQRGAAGDIERLTREIAVLSGMMAEADKAIYKSA